MTWRLFVPLVIAGCIEPNLRACPDDLLCPIADLCDPVHHICITPDQQHACDGLSDHASCNAGGDVGTCLDGVCLLEICGDGFVAPNEACDDGNRTSGDGCNATCTSTEVCGNGVTDVALGEQCDDGNTLAGDGCDSRCRSERETWTVTGVRPQFVPGQGHTAYDALHHQTIHLIDGLTWTWDGTTWSLLSSVGPSWAGIGEYQLVWDPDRARVVYLGSHASVGTVDQIWDWDGTKWTQLVIQASPTLYNINAVYDRARRVVLVSGTYSTRVLWQLDLGSATWTQRTSPPNMAYGASAFAYDEARAVGVLVVAGASSQVTEWNGTTWSVPATVAMPVTYTWTLAYDPRLAAVIAIGGGTSVAKWNGAAWTALPSETLPEGGNSPDVWFDVDRMRRIVFDASNHLYEWDGAQWQQWADPTPTTYFESFNMRVAYDPGRDELVTYGSSANGGTETRAFDGHAWRLLEPAPNSAIVFAMMTSSVYDPVRGAIVMIDNDKGTYLLKDEHWITLEPPGTSMISGGEMLAYDPVRRAVIGISLSGAWSLSSDATHWTKLPLMGPTFGVPSPATSAFDVRDSQLVMVGSSAVSLFDGTTISSSLSPGSGYTVIGDQRRGSVELLGSGGPETSTWERVDGVWSERPGLPLAIDGVPTYEPRGARAFVIGLVGQSRVIATRTFVGPSPLEQCSGHDDDGDGLVDCADPDCFWSCTPACPPYVTCP